MGRLSLLKLERLEPPAPDWRWDVILPQIGNAETPALVENITFNHLRIPSTGRYGGGTQLYYPGNNEIEGTPLKFYETIRYTATKYIYAWKALVLNSDGTYNLPIHYKKSITINAYNYVNDNTPVFTGVLEGVWPTDPESFSYTYENRDRLTVSCNFSVDSSRFSDSEGNNYAPVGDVFNFGTWLRSVFP